MRWEHETLNTPTLGLLKRNLQEFAKAGWRLKFFVLADGGYGYTAVLERAIDG